MTFLEIAREALRLEHVFAEKDGIHIIRILFAFENGNEIVLSVNPDTDELVWDLRPSRLEGWVDLANIFPCVNDAIGYFLAWGWEMTNHQGHFDAVQMQFMKEGFESRGVLQFVAAASFIHIHEVCLLKTPMDE